MKAVLVASLTFTLSVLGHPLERDRKLRRGTPFPTGPGFDVLPIDKIVRVGDGTPAPVVPLPAVFNAGSIPSGLGPGALGLPDISAFDASAFPALDARPPVDSPEVLEWLKELEGADIPNFAPTKDGTCAADPAAVEQAGAEGRCWWTCSGGCVRPTDIVDCPDRSNFGVTFDDGPSEYTPKLLHYLDSIDTKASFYVVGSRVVSAPETVRTQLMMGHELSIHTWSHPALTSLTNAEIVAELGWTRKAIKDVTGATPTTFRPPFGDIDDRVRAVAAAMGLTPVMWSFAGPDKPLDTFDYNVPGGVATSQETVTNFRETLTLAEQSRTQGIIVLEHDLFQETVDLAISAHLPDALTRAGPLGGKWKLGSVPQCLGRAPGLSYKETSADTAPEAPAPPTTPTPPATPVPPTENPAPIPPVAPAPPTNELPTKPTPEAPVSSAPVAPPSHVPVSETVAVSSSAAYPPATTTHVPPPQHYVPPSYQAPAPAAPEQQHPAPDQKPEPSSHVPAPYTEQPEYSWEAPQGSYSPPSADHSMPSENTEVAPPSVEVPYVPPYGDNQKEPSTGIESVESTPNSNVAAPSLEEVVVGSAKDVQAPAGGAPIVKSSTVPLAFTASPEATQLAAGSTSWGVRGMEVRSMTVTIGFATLVMSGLAYI